MAFEALITLSVVRYYLILRKRTLYSYKNASFLGGSIFMVSMLAFSFAMIFEKSININPILAYITNVSNISDMFLLIALPLLLIFLLFMSASNI